jgi:predicted metal-dependent phosphoesterase TrpH
LKVQEKLLRARADRNPAIIAKLNELGVRIDEQEVIDEAGGQVVGRPHIAGVMVDRGYVPDIATAFDLYLRNGGPAYVGRPRLDPARAIRLALASGGVPILAHPQSLGYESDPQLEGILRQLAEMGLVGVETHHSAIEPYRRRILRRMAERIGLAPSGGSDFHGAYKPGIAVGTGCGDLLVPDEFLEDLRARRGVQ